MQSELRQNGNGLPDKIYFSIVAEIIAKSVSLANMPSLTEIEIGNRARDWYDLFYGVIPEDKLFPAFQDAFAAHDNAFPVSAYEVKAAYEQMKRIEAMSSKVVKFADGRYDCPFCFGTGRLYKFDIDGRTIGVFNDVCNHTGKKSGIPYNKTKQLD